MPFFRSIQKDTPSDSKKARRIHPVVGRMFMVLVALAVVLCLCLWSLKQQKTPFETVSADSAPYGTTVTTTASTTVETAVSTTATTTSQVTTTATTSKATTTTAPRALLTYDTAGHYVQPANAPWNLLLVNDWNPLPAGYDNSVVMVSTERNQQVDRRMIADLNAMLQAGAEYGIGVQSGYRPASQQNRLYWRKVDEYAAKGYNNEEAQLAAGKVVKRPGYSEHNCGLAVDLGGSGNFRLEMDFRYTDAYAWLIENCADYGFILRFPPGKEDITGVVYEPWHYRYVGKEAAQEIMTKGICLEEFLEMNGQ